MTNETLLDTSAPAADATNDTTLLDTKPADGTNQDGAPSDKQAPPLDKDGKPADGTTPKAPDDTTADKAPVVPESYADPKLPDGITLDPTLKSEFDVVAKDLKLTQEQYQKIVDIQTKGTENQMKQTMDIFNKQISDWAEERKSVV